MKVNKLLPVLIFWFLTVFSFTQEKEIKTALVIGNSSYKQPLNNAENNALSAAQVFESLGFDVTLKVNADQRTMIDAVNEFSKKIKSSDTSVIYYSGFAFQTAVDGYLLPVDASVESEEDLAYKALSSADVMAKMARSKCKRNFVFFDTAYYVSFLEDGDAPRDLAVPTSVKDMEGLFMFSSIPVKAFNTKNKEASPFTKSVLKNIMEEGADIRLSSGLIIKDTRDAAGSAVILTSSSLVAAYIFNTGIKEEVVQITVEEAAVIEEPVETEQNLEVLNTLLQKKAAAEKKYAAMKGSRTAGFISLGTGVVLGGTAAAFYILGLQAKSDYNSARFSTESEDLRELCSFFSVGTIAAGTGAGISLIISPITFIASAKLSKTEAEILDLNEQIALFNKQ